MTQKNNNRFSFELKNEYSDRLPRTKRVGNFIHSFLCSLFRPRPRCLWQQASYDGATAKLPQAAPATVTDSLVAKKKRCSIFGGERREKVFPSLSSPSIPLTTLDRTAKGCTIKYYYNFAQNTGALNANIWHRDTLRHWDQQRKRGLCLHSMSSKWGPPLKIYLGTFVEMELRHFVVFYFLTKRDQVVIAWINGQQ